MQSLSIRRAKPEDAPAFARMMSEPEVYAGLLQVPFPSEAEWRARLTESPKPDLILVAESAGEPVGHAGLQLAGPSPRRRHVMGLGIGVVGAAQRQGVGTALMRALLDYADGWVQALRIELTVYADNAAAIALYRKFGFRIEGTHRAYALRGGVFVDAHAMARLHPRPPRLPDIEPEAR